VRFFLLGPRNGQLMVGYMYNRRSLRIKFKDFPTIVWTSVKRVLFLFYHTGWVLIFIFIFFQFRHWVKTWVLECFFK
jgi:hypothetical protein